MISYRGIRQLLLIGLVLTLWIAAPIWSSGSLLAQSVSNSTTLCFSSTQEPTVDCAPTFGLVTTVRKTSPPSPIAPLVGVESGNSEYPATSPDTFTSATYNTATRATFGTLQSKSELHVFGRPASKVTHLFSGSKFTDTFTFSGGVGQAYVRFGLLLKGTMSGSNPGIGFGGPVGYSTIHYTFNGSGDKIGPVLPPRLLIQSISQQVYSQPIPFTFGIGTTVTFAIQTESQLKCLPSTFGTGCSLWSGASTTDFRGTGPINLTSGFGAVLNFIEVTDSIGRPILNFQIASASRVSYSKSGPVPARICDVNSDGGLNVADVQTMVNQILGILPKAANDLNGDGDVNVVDVQILVNGILGKWTICSPFGT